MYFSIRFGKLVPWWGIRKWYSAKPMKWIFFWNILKVNISIFKFCFYESIIMKSSNNYQNNKIWSSSKYKKKQQKYSTKFIWIFCPHLLKSYSYLHVIVINYSIKTTFLCQKQKIILWKHFKRINEIMIKGRQFKKFLKI